MRPENKEYTISQQYETAGFVKNKKQTKLERPRDEVWKTNREKED